MPGENLLYLFPSYIAVSSPVLFVIHLITGLITLILLMPLAKHPLKMLLELLYRNYSFHLQLPQKNTFQESSVSHMPPGTFWLFPSTISSTSSLALFQVFPRFLHLSPRSSQTPLTLSIVPLAANHSVALNLSCIPSSFLLPHLSIFSAPPFPHVPQFKDLPPFPITHPLPALFAFPSTYCRVFPFYFSFFLSSPNIYHLILGILLSFRLCFLHFRFATLTLTTYGLWSDNYHLLLILTIVWYLSFFLVKKPCPFPFILYVTIHIYHLMRLMPFIKIPTGVMHSASIILATHSSPCIPISHIRFKVAPRHHLSLLPIDT